MSRRFTQLALRGFFFSTRIVWIVSRVLAMGVLLAIAVITDRPRRTHLIRWILLKGDRLWIAGSLTAAVFVFMLALYSKGGLDVANTGFITTFFGSVISGLFSFVPIVVAVNQLTVSQLFGSPETLREQIADVREFRQNVTDFTPDEAGVPTAPDEFLADFTAVIVSEAATLQTAVADRDGEAATAIKGYVETIFAQAEEIDARLKSHSQPLIDVLVPMMGDGYSRNVVDARQLRRKYDGTLGDHIAASLEKCEDLFVTMDVLRQYYKALYVKQELAVLSRLIAYSGLATFFICALVIIAFASGPILPARPIVLEIIVSAAVAASVAPFAILCSYMIRIATIAKRTIAPGAFTPRRETPEHRRHVRSYNDN